MEIRNSKIQWKLETVKCNGNQKQQNAMEIGNSKMRWKSETAKCNGKNLIVNIKMHCAEKKLAVL